MAGKVLSIKTSNGNIAVIKKGGKYLCLEVSKVQNDKWITVKPHGEEGKGKHLKLEGDETPKEAMKRQWGVDVDKRKKQAKTEEKPSVKDMSEIEVDVEINGFKDIERQYGGLSTSDKERLKELKTRKADIIREFYSSASKQYKAASNIETLRKQANGLTDHFDRNNFSEDSNLNVVNSATKTILDTFAKYKVGKKLESYKEENRPDCLACANGTSVILSTKLSQASDEKIRKMYNDNFASYRAKEEITKKTYEELIKEAEENNNKNLVQIYVDSARKAEEKSFKRWTVKTTEENYVRDSINHELGHYFMGNALRKDIQSGALLKGTSPIQLRSSLPTYKELLKVFSKAKRNKDIYKISEYASESPDEFFAECFAMKEGGEELPQYINDFIEGVVKK